MLIISQLTLATFYILLYVKVLNSPQGGLGHNFWCEVKKLLFIGLGAHMQYEGMTYHRKSLLALEVAS